MEKEFHKEYNLKAIKIIFALLFGCNYLINIDHGTIPASTLNLKSDLGLDNVALGFLGSIVYLGLTFGKKIMTKLIAGSLMATPIFCYLKAKYILASSFLLNSFALFLFTLTPSFFILALSRFLVGFCQVSTVPKNIDPLSYRSSSAYIRLSGWTLSLLTDTKRSCSHFSCWPRPWAW